MSKPKNPLLSFEASGTLADSITFTRRRETDIVQKKPIPGYRRTLPQVYQRWLYEDYAYLWRQQSIATRQSYQSLGSRYHLTGFQYWMKYQLTNLPDIVGWWKLDEKSGAIAHDSSKQGNNGTIFGASPTTGVINDGFYFDGLNDYINAPHSPSLDISEVISLDVLVKIEKAGTQCILSKRWSAAAYQGWAIYWATNKFRMENWQPGAYTVIVSSASYPPGSWHHVLGVDNPPNPALLFIDGILDGTDPTPGLSIPQNTLPFRIGNFASNVSWLEGIIDNVIIYNRALDQNDAIRHSERRYP